MDSIRKLAAVLAGTPAHPQWLLGRRKIPGGVTSAFGTVLDVGAADRWVESHLPRGVDYVALDYPATGRDLYGARPHVFADAALLPFQGEQFDGVICLEVLEHVPAPAKVVSEIARVLKPGGTAWISMPFLYPLHDAPFDFQRYTEFGLRRDANNAGLEVLFLGKRDHSLRAAGALMCLAIAGGVHSERGWTKIALLPLVFVAVLLINVACWIGSLVWPDWGHMSTGYQLKLRRR
jgi:2-polyprenyl-3-methyl-5-hydroxy-6-metoxy-1,4-benzoquinol methylase